MKAFIDLRKRQSVRKISKHLKKISAAVFFLLLRLMNDLQTNSCMLYQEEHLKFMNQTETDSTDFLALW